MKTLNQFRSTKNFSILGVEMGDIARIVEYVKSIKGSLVGCAHIKDEPNVYTVRYTCHDNTYIFLIDEKINVAFSEVRVLDSREIVRQRTKI